MSDPRNLRIVGAYLDFLELRATESRNLLEESSGINGLVFTGTEEMQSTFDHFLSRWDRHRGDLRVGMESVANAFGATKRAFDQTDTEMAAALRGNGSAADDR